MPSSPPRSPRGRSTGSRLHGDRIARVVRSPDGFAVEHDAASGDLYLQRPRTRRTRSRPTIPVTLFIGTERGFTYRLTLTPAERGSAQILIRNPGAMPGAAQGVDGAGPALAGDPHDRGAGPPGARGGAARAAAGV